MKIREYLAAIKEIEERNRKRVEAFNAEHGNERRVEPWRPATEDKMIKACAERDCKWHDDEYDNGCFMFGTVGACTGKQTGESEA